MTCGSIHSFPQSPASEGGPHGLLELFAQFQSGCPDHGQDLCHSENKIQVIFESTIRELGVKNNRQADIYELKVE